MGLNKAQGNMYDFVTHTWNTVKGICPHGCIYCYMKRRGNLKSVRFDEKELKTGLGAGNFIFVGSSCDMFAEEINADWITQTLNHCKRFDNQYLFQSKNPGRMNQFSLPPKSIVCTTIETNRHYPEVMKNSPAPIQRAIDISKSIYPKYITIEPILDFDLEPFVELIKMCKPVQVNIGADSGGNKLPEPDTEKIAKLILELKVFTAIKQKANLARLID